MTPTEVNKLWETYGNQAWAKCIPQVREILNNLALSDDIPADQAKSIVQTASMAAARAYRLGFKIGSLVGEREAKSVKIITDLTQRN